MKKVLLSLLAVVVGTSAFAQILKVTSIEKVSTPKGAMVAGISPKGDYLLLTGNNLTGLVKFDLATSRKIVISTARSAGYQAKISDDGKNVVYREDNFVKGLRYSDVNQKNFTTGKITRLLKSARKVQGVSVQGGTALVVNSGRMTKSVIAKSPIQATAPVVSIDGDQLMITKNGITSVLSPNGTDRSYIWPSVSPDGKKVCYYAFGLGCCVCDISGNNVQILGDVHAAQWWDNNTIVAMNDVDDGHTITASAIVVKTLDGKSQELTSKSQKGMYPYVSADSKKIAYTTLDGETYIINVK